MTATVAARALEVATEAVQDSLSGIALEKINSDTTTNKDDIETGATVAVQDSAGETKAA